MNREKWILFILALGLIAGTGGMLKRVSAHQRLGAPGVKTHPIPGSIRLQVELPEDVLDYKSKFQEIDEVTRVSLPADTSFGQRIYVAPDGFGLLLTAVLMGSDRTSLHKPQYCLTGQGWQIDPLASSATSVPVSQPAAYDLPVVKLISTKALPDANGVVGPRRGLYVYWFVADDALSASVGGWERMWWLAKHLVLTGELQRWAYVSCFVQCLPGQEEAAFERVKAFIAAAVPQFQLTPKAPAPPTHDVASRG